MSTGPVPATPPTDCNECGNARRWRRERGLKAYGGDVVRYVGEDPYCPADPAHRNLG